MGSRTFRGETLQDALDRARAALGEGAVVLEARQSPPGMEVESSWVAGSLGPRTWFEVRVDAGGVHTPIPSAQERVGDVSKDGRRGFARDEGGKDSNGLESIPPQALTLWKRLVADDAPPERAWELVAATFRTAPGPPESLEQARNWLWEELTNRIVVAPQPDAPPEGEPARLVALTGPSGGGKTTAAIRLATELALRRGRQVGLAAIDDSDRARRGLADLFDLPLARARNLDELPAAVERLRLLGLRVIVLDLPPTGPADEEDLSRLSRALRQCLSDGASSGLETHVVVSASSSPSFLADTVRAHRERLGASRVILGKLDEPTRPANLLAILDQPLGFVQTGPPGKGGLGRPSPRALARLILGWPPGSQSDWERSQAIRPDDL